MFNACVARKREEEAREAHTRARRQVISNKQLVATYGLTRWVAVGGCGGCGVQVRLGACVSVRARAVEMCQALASRHATRATMPRCHRAAGMRV